MSSKHPQIQNPSEHELAALLAGKEPSMRQIYLETHRLLLNALPSVAYSVDAIDGVTGYGARQFGYDGWGMAALAVHAKWVSLLFLRGADLEDPLGLLEGKGKKVRHVKLRSLAQVEQQRDALRRLIGAAAQLMNH